jgi:hypothetical protein
MRGLEIAEKYYWKYGAPMIEEKFGDYKERIAIGLVGEGSQCYGFDDEMSRDHDWGPEFCLWLNQQDFTMIGAKLENELIKLPTDFEGIGPRNITDWGNGRVGVFEIRKFYARFIGIDHVPSNLKEWRRIPESYLATCTNGKIFTDPLGEFTSFREGLKNYYPEDVRLKKIASRSMTLAQVGQYNYPRCVMRKEFVAAQYIEAQFSANIISLVFLLNRHYTPFYKWMHRAVRELPILGETVYNLLLDISISHEIGKKIRNIEKTCAVVMDELRRVKLSDSPSEFFLDHGPIIQSKIQDLELRNADVRIE